MNDVKVAFRKKSLINTDVGFDINFGNSFTKCKLEF